MYNYPSESGAWGLRCRFFTLKLICGETVYPLTEQNDFFTCTLVLHLVFSLIRDEDVSSETKTSSILHPFTSTVFVLYLLTILCTSSHTEVGIDTE